LHPLSGLVNDQFGFFDKTKLKMDFLAYFEKKRETSNAIILKQLKTETTAFFSIISVYYVLSFSSFAK